MQRSAGNSAVNALMAARLRFPGEEARADIDEGLRELRKDEPAVDPLEKGLKAAKELGIPVDLEGIRPPASALAVTTTGFGPEAVGAKKPVPPPKPVPAASPLGKAAAKGAKPVGGGPGSAAPAPEMTAVAAAAEPAALSGEELLQPPVEPPGVEPASDPAFTSVTKNVKTFAKAKRAHPPAASKAKEAQDAALAPTDDLTGQAKAAKADTMDAQQPGSFDKKAFIASVKAAIEAKSPKTLKEADDYKESGKAREVKGEVKGLVTQGKEGQAKDIEAATEAPPDQSTAVPKPVTPMGPEPPGSAVPIPAAGAVPKPAPPEQLNLEAGKHQANQELADGEVSEEQLADSGEPQFEQALVDKKKAAEHADTAPGEYRKQEQQVIEQGRTDAATETKEGVEGMQGAKGAALAKLVADKGKTKSKDEQKRAEVTAKIQSIFNATETAVKEILDGIDPKVEKEFEDGEKSARATFENYVSAKMSAYKEDRYGGWTGKFRWLRDKIRGMPDKVNEFYVAGRELYLEKMNVTIARVADIVGGDLTAAKKRIASGKLEISTYVKSLPNDLKKVGSEASQEIGERFEQLESEVDSKQESVVDTLATKYVAARKGLDERIEELQAENRGLVDKVIGAIKAIVNTIRELVAMLKNVLARVAGVVGDIIKHPVRFLGNLIDGIKSGINRFKDNFLGHLRKGLLSWLFGALAEGGVELPDTFDLKGVIKLLASLFGLTWRFIRDRIVKQIGEKAMAAVEKGVDIFQKLAAGGVGALWEMLLEKLGDIKEMILEQVKDFVLTKIITAGITWLISLLNPAAAFIKACKLIYDVVMFFVDNASRIAKFVNTILDSVADIVRGNISGVAAKIEDVLGQMVPIIIGFLASVIGLGGIGAKIREIVQKLQKPVAKALDFVIKTGLKLAGPVIRGVKGIAGKVKSKVATGKAWVKGKAEAGKQWVKGKWEGLRRRVPWAGESHTVIATEGGNPRLLMQSAERDAVDNMKDEVDRAAQSKNPDRLREAWEMLAAAMDAEQKVKSAGKTKDANAIAVAKAHFGRFLAALRDYAAKWGRRKGMLVPEAELKEGSIRPYNLQARGGKGEFEHEHIVPGALFAAWLGLERASAAINAMYANMMTVTWKFKAARIKTSSDLAMISAMKAKRDAFLSRPEVALELKKRGRWAPGEILPNPSELFGSLDDLKDDRVKASVSAASAAGSKVTRAQIEATAGAQLVNLKALLGQLLSNGARRNEDDRTLQQKWAAVDGAVAEVEAVMDKSGSSRETVATALGPIKDKYRLTTIKIVEGAKGTFRVYVELNPRRNTKDKDGSGEFSLAPGGYPAWEGTEIPTTTNQGTPGPAADVHLLTRHVQITREGLRQRVGGVPVASAAPGGPVRAVPEGLGDRLVGQASRFLSEKVMRESLDEAIAGNGSRIQKAFNAPGVAIGENLSITWNCRRRIGEAYRVMERRQNTPNANPQAWQGYDQNPLNAPVRRVEEVTGVLKEVQAILRVTDVKNRHFVVQTAFPV